MTQSTQAQSTQAQSIQAQSTQAQSTQYGVVLVTASSQSEAESIAQHLVESQLAACVNLIPIRSIYTWQGEIHHDEEWQLLIKTDLHQFAQLETKIRSIHSYEVAEIIALPIVAGSQPYLNWMAEQTAKPNA